MAERSKHDRTVTPDTVMAGIEAERAAGTDDNNAATHPHDEATYLIRVHAEFGPSVSPPTLIELALAFQVWFRSTWAASYAKATAERVDL